MSQGSLGTVVVVVATLVKHGSAKCSVVFQRRGSYLTVCVLGELREVCVVLSDFRRCCPRHVGGPRSFESAEAA
jgi:hypothetical protein